MPDTKDLAVAIWGLCSDLDSIRAVSVTASDDGPCTRVWVTSLAAEKKIKERIGKSELAQLIDADSITFIRN